MQFAQVACLRASGADKWGQSHASPGRHTPYLGLGESDSERQARYRSLFESRIEGKLLSDIRQSVNRGLAFGSERFGQEIEDLGGRRQRQLKRGPKPRLEA